MNNKPNFEPQNQKTPILSNEALRWIKNQENKENRQIEKAISQGRLINCLNKF